MEAVVNILIPVAFIWRLWKVKTTFTPTQRLDIIFSCPRPNNSLALSGGYQFKHFLLAPSLPRLGLDFLCCFGWGLLVSALPSLS